MSKFLNGMTADEIRKKAREIAERAQREKALAEPATQSAELVAGGSCEAEYEAWQTQIVIADAAQTAANLEAATRDILYYWYIMCQSGM